MDKIVSEMTSRAFVAPSSATKDDSPLSSADVRTIVIIIKINCQRDQYHQVKAKLEGQATAMMGVTLLNLGTVLTKHCFHYDQLSIIIITINHHHHHQE